jgi:hypothetical protein
MGLWLLVLLAVMACVTIAVLSPIAVAVIMCLLGKR